MAFGEASRGRAEPCEAFGDASGGLAFPRGLARALRRLARPFARPRGVPRSIAGPFEKPREASRGVALEMRACLSRACTSQLALAPRQRRAARSGHGGLPRCDTKLKRRSSAAHMPLERRCGTVMLGGCSPRSGTARAPLWRSHSAASTRYKATAASLGGTRAASLRLRRGTTRATAGAPPLGRRRRATARGRAPLAHNITRLISDNTPRSTP